MVLSPLPHTPPGLLIGTVYQLELFRIQSCRGQPSTAPLSLAALAMYDLSPGSLHEVTDSIKHKGRALHITLGSIGLV